MTKLIGYQLVDKSNTVISSWESVDGGLTIPPMPNYIILPNDNNDQVHCPKLDTYYPVDSEDQQWKIIEWYRSPTNLDVNQEKDRRLGLGFDYNFGDTRGIHHIGTSNSDMAGWNEVTTWATVSIISGQTSNLLQIKTDTGIANVTPSEWLQILNTATTSRQPIWAASFVISNMSPIPDDYTDDKYWTS